MANVLKNFCKNYEILPLKIPILLKFKLSGLYKKLGGNDHNIDMSCSNTKVSLTTKKVIVEEGWAFYTFIEAGSITTATLECSVDGVKNIRILFKFLDSKDVFQKIKYDLLMAELNYIAPEVNNPLPHSEYAGNYCMGAAERGLSELLSDAINFYAVERVTNKRKNKVSFSAQSAIDRGKKFESLGYTESFHKFNEYKIVNRAKDLIYNAKDEAEAITQYTSELYNIIQFTATGQNNLTKIFDDDIKDKELGYHIYYLTVTDGFHTLLLIIDKLSDPCNPKYEIWDQHGKTKSIGLLTDIAEGIRKQTSWTFANSCLNRYKSKKTKYVDSTNTYLWKIKRK